jgi:hypothetical protein
MYEYLHWFLQLTKRKLSAGTCVETVVVVSSVPETTDNGENIGEQEAGSATREAGRLLRLALVVLDASGSADPEPVGLEGCC